MKQYIQTHIERTGGTYSKDRIINHFGKEKTYVYDPIIDRFQCATELTLRGMNPTVDQLKRTAGPLLPLIYKLYFAVSALLPKKGISLEDLSQIQWNAIIGHFTADQFDGVLTDPQIEHGVVIRNPLQRTFSEYCYLRKVGHSPHWREPIADARGSFRDFAFDPSRQNWQTKCLGERELSDFQYIGVTSRLDHFLHQLTGQSKQGPHVNAASGPLSQMDFNSEQFMDFHSEDYNLYENALERVQSDLREI